MSFSSPSRPLPHLQSSAPTQAASTFGPDFWYSRRAQWLAPASDVGTAKADLRPDQSRSAMRLISLLDEPGAEEDDEIWDSGLKGVWETLVAGRGHLKHPIPLKTGIKILRAGWLRDGTWPPHATAPSSGDEKLSLPVGDQENMRIHRKSQPL